MSAQFRAPDPVRAHLNATLNTPALRPPAARLSPTDQRASRPPAAGRRALVTTAIALAAPALALGALVGLGAASGGGLGGDLGSLQGAAGVEGTATTGSFASTGFEEDDFDRARKEKDRDTAEKPRPRAPVEPPPDLAPSEPSEPVGLTPGGKSPTKPVSVPVVLPDDDLDPGGVVPSPPNPGDDGADDDGSDGGSSGGTGSDGSGGSGGSGDSSGTGGPVAQAATSGAVG